MADGGGETGAKPSNVNARSTGQVGLAASAGSAELSPPAVGVPVSLLPVSPVDDSAVERVLTMLTGKGQSCTQDDAITALRHTGGHIGKAVNRLSGLLSARAEAGLLGSSASPLPVIVANGGSSVSGGGGGAGAGAGVSVEAEAAAATPLAALEAGAFDATDVRTVIDKVQARGIAECTERDALGALQKAGGHVGKAVNLIAGHAGPRQQEPRPTDGSPTARTAAAPSATHAVAPTTSGSGAAVLTVTSAAPAAAAAAGDTAAPAAAAVSEVVGKLASRGVACTQEQAQRALQVAGGHVGRALNWLASRLSA